MAARSKLRFDFIDLVFALAIGQVGIELGDFYYNINTKFSLIESLGEFPYVYTHLLLCIFIISSSWVGWNLSQSKANHEDLKKVFSIQFLILIFDLLLVFFYFIMVKGVEKPLGERFSEPECETEIKWSFVIFVFYFFWDIAAKWDLAVFKKRGWQAPACGLLVFLFYRQSNCTAVNEHSPTVVCVTDIGLLAIFALFRVLKEIASLKDTIGRENPHPLYDWNNDDFLNVYTIENSRPWKLLWENRLMYILIFVLVIIATCFIINYYV